MADAFEIRGHCDDRFASVKEAFAGNFRAGLEVGASFAATIDGELVVDIWAGHADEARTRPWERDTIVCVWSTGKVMTTICALMLVDRGQLDLDAPVAGYWPEFAQGGKENILVRHLLSHTAGLPAFDEPIPLEDLYDWDKMTDHLARQRPEWEPGTQCGYHAMTFGFLVGEVFRRVAGKTVGRYFREEVAGPLGIDFHFGLPAEHEPRVGEIVPSPDLRPGDDGYIPPGSMLYRAMNFPETTGLISRDRAFRQAELPASNGHGNARSVARAAAVLACGGELDGVRLLSTPTVQRALEEQYFGTDLVFGVPLRWGLGVALNNPDLPIGPNPRTCFWGGWGGSQVIADLDARVSLAYVMNKMGVRIVGDPRGPSIAMALFAALS